MTSNLDWPRYFKDKLVLGDMASNVGIATLWMPKETVVADLDPKTFCVVGQFYNKRGINPMFRNIFANPKLRYLVICGVDRMGSGEAVKKFFNQGFEKKLGPSGEVLGYAILGDSEALLDKQFSEAALSLLRQQVTFVDMRLTPTSEVAKTVATFPTLPEFSKPMVFDDPPPPQAEHIPSDLSVFKIRRDYISDAWLDVLKTVNKFGVETPGLYGMVKCVHNLCVVVDQEAAASPKLEPFLKFGAEGLQNYITGFFSKNETKDEAYTYGERIFAWDGLDQFELMKEKLNRFPSDRGALAMLWQPQKDNFPPTAEAVAELGQTKGWRTPCLVMLLAQCLDDKLYLTATFRSNDMYGAWPLNAFALRELQTRLAKAIGKSVGPLTTISQIAEIYQIDWEDAQKIVTEHDTLARTCSYDPRGYYTVAVEDTDIVVKFFTADGATQLLELKQDGTAPKAARDLCARAMAEFVISELGAAMDFGRQVAKAETAIKLGLDFTQDNQLKLK